MKTYPLESISIQEAKEMQFKLIDTVTKHFKGHEVLNMGDLGVVGGLNKPSTTLKVEEVLSDYFGTENAVLLRGAGTGAIRAALISMVGPQEKLLIHDAPVYPTTNVIIESMGINKIKADYNEESSIRKVLEQNQVQGALIQYTRQKIDDRYDIKAVIHTMKECMPELPILTDDNYAVMKVRNIGVQSGADISAFSTFKLLGPVGVGCAVGKGKYIKKLIKMNYSGGSQVQGYEAMEVLRGLIYAPVMLAISSQVTEELVSRLNSGEIKEVKTAFIANAQSKVLLIEFNENIAHEVLIETEKLGAAPNPVGAESKFEFVPMMYRVSGTFRESDPTLEERMIRINPMRCGADTVIRILKSAVLQVNKTRR